MREILFRGKKTGFNEWVQGVVIRPYNDSKLMYSFFDTIANTLWVVDAETVGQYTSLTDRNGKKIFEGDVVEIEHTWRIGFYQEVPESYKPRRSHSCFWDDDYSELHYKRNYAVEYKEKDARFILRNGSDQHDLKDAFIFFHKGIIIGNIHDNPELLKEGVGE